MPYESIARVLGYRPNWNVSGAQLIPAQKAAALLDLLPQTAQSASVGAGSMAAESEQLDELLELDARHEIEIRKEQGKIRRFLFGSANTIRCAFCGEDFPSELIVAAHVKRRADCSDVEKRDFRNNVIPLCCFGCDDLFERGYLIVLDNGKLAINREPGTARVKQRLSFLHGRSCESFSERNAVYFRAHRTRSKNDAGPQG
jgi:hypothetical protein